MSSAHGTQIPMPEVEPCVTQIYQDVVAGMWWRYCLTCDNGSNKHGRHHRGHKTKADAEMSARDHAKAATRNRRWRAWHRLWVTEILAADTWEQFVAVYRLKEPHWRRIGWPPIDWDRFPEDKRDQTMAQVKATYAEEPR